MAAAAAADKKADNKKSEPLQFWLFEMIIDVGVATNCVRNRYNYYKLTMAVAAISKEDAMDLCRPTFMRALDEHDVHFDGEKGQKMRASMEAGFESGDFMTRVDDSSGGAPVIMSAAECVY